MFTTKYGCLCKKKKKKKIMKQSWKFLTMQNEDQIGGQQGRV
jgi:hypothetical protein